jgi:hypothetical protein
VQHRGQHCLEMEVRTGDIDMSVFGNFYFHQNVPWNFEMNEWFKIAGFCPVFFSLFWGHVCFTFQHNLGTFCQRRVVEVSLNFSGQNLK